MLLFTQIPVELEELSEMLHLQSAREQLWLKWENFNKEPLLPPKIDIGGMC